MRRWEERSEPATVLATVPAMVPATVPEVLDMAEEVPCKPGVMIRRMFLLLVGC